LQGERDNARVPRLTDATTPELAIEEHHITRVQAFRRGERAAVALDRLVTGKGLATLGGFDEFEQD
jgi:hypothetical protein